MKIKLASWNINGIRACADKGLRDFIKKSKRDIIALQEIKALEDQVPEDLQSPKSFFTYFAPAKKKGYSGVALYSRKTLGEPKVSIGIGIDKFDDEGRTIIAEYDSFILINGYFPNGQRDHNRVPFKLEYSRAVAKKAMSLKKKTKKEIIICGDINTAHKEIDLTNPKTNKKTTGFLIPERDWIDELLSLGFCDVFRELNGEAEGHYSWWSYRNDCRGRNIGWRIDYFFATKKLLPQITRSEYLPKTLGSDHCPVILDLSVS